MVAVSLLAQWVLLVDCMRENTNRGIILLGYLYSLQGPYVIQMCVYVYEGICVLYLYVYIYARIEKQPITLR